jgi:hypothetical protein
LTASIRETVQFLLVILCNKTANIVITIIFLIQALEEVVL